MADQLFVYDVTCPASTPSTSPLEVAQLSGGLYVVEQVRLVLPAGHAGLTGIALAFGHQAVIPYNAGAYISGDDETFDYQLGDYPNGVPWTVFLVNNDTQSHIWELRWQVNILNQTPNPTAQTLIDTQDIYSAAPDETGLIDVPAS